MSKMSIECRENICPCMDPCPLKNAMDILGGKWKIPILCALWFDGKMRYNELSRRIKGISNTMLASSLRELEHDGLIQRVQYPEIPVRVEYSVTEECAELVPAIEMIGAWSRKKLSEVRSEFPDSGAARKSGTFLLQDGPGTADGN